MPRVTVLYHRRDTSTAGTSVDAHHHPFWQLEAVLRGRVKITAGGGANAHTWIVGPGRAVLLPPRETHSLRYPVEADYLSIKFESPDAPAGLAGLMPESACARDVLAALAKLLPAGETRRATLAEEVSALVAMLLRHWHRIITRAIEPPTGPAARLKHEADTAGGRQRSVQAIARAAGLSRGHALAVFQSAYGRTLKDYLYEVCAEQACALLCYSERSLGEIADALAFPDLFSFSRFFRRLRGRAPSAYRAAVRAQREALLRPR